MNNESRTEEGIQALSLYILMISIDGHAFAQAALL